MVSTPTPAAPATCPMVSCRSIFALDSVLRYGIYPTPHGPETRGEMAALTAGRSLLAAILAGIGASLCCVVPLLLLALGIGGAWIANLTALEPYRPVFIGIALLFFGIAFRK